MKILGKDNPYTGKEKDLQSAVIKLLRYYGYFCIHVPNGGSRNIIEASNLKKQGALAGCPDILVFNNISKAKGVAIELKVKGGKLSEKQDMFIYMLESYGWDVFVCYNLESIECLIKESAF